jgi:hypothetical protein
MPVQLSALFGNFKELISLQILNASTLMLALAHYGTVFIHGGNGSAAIMGCCW